MSLSSGNVKPRALAKAAWLNGLSALIASSTAPRVADLLHGLTEAGQLGRSDAAPVEAVEDEDDVLAANSARVMSRSSVDGREKSGAGLP